MLAKDSALYKIRRKGQLLARHILPDEMLAKIYSWVILKKSVNLKNPQTFNEKIQWLKINHFPNIPLVAKCTDKYAVRQYIKSKGLESTLVHLLGVWEKAEDIDWDKLPNKFVLKCNHGCAYNILCADKNKLDKTVAMKKLNKWLKEDFGGYNIEPHYSNIHPHVIICEEYLGGVITDYKFFCFNGQPKYIYVSNDLAHDRQAQISFFNLDGTKIPLIRDDYAPLDIVEWPSFFDAMKNDAITLSRDFVFVRVDFFIANGRYYFAELTFTPSAGMMPFNPDSYDQKWGEELDIENIIRRE